jgi:hypothetical protein
MLYQKTDWKGLEHKICLEEKITSDSSVIDVEVGYFQNSDAFTDGDWDNKVKSWSCGNKVNLALCYDHLTFTTVKTGDEEVETAKCSWTGQESFKQYAKAAMRLDRDDSSLISSVIVNYDPT